PASRVAAREHRLSQVYDYVAGKADWGSFGLPLEGTKGARAGEHVRADVPTCRLEERLQDVRRVVSAAGWDTCIVVNASGVVLGRLGRKALAIEEDVAVEAVMTVGTSRGRQRCTLVAYVVRLQQRELEVDPLQRNSAHTIG